MSVHNLPPTGTMPPPEEFEYAFQYVHTAFLYCMSGIKENSPHMFVCGLYKNLEMKNMFDDHRAGCMPLRSRNAPQRAEVLPSLYTLRRSGVGKHHRAVHTTRQ